MSRRTYVFDDAVADGFAPFSLTRPCGEILYGAWTVRQRLERIGAPVAGHVSRPWLADYREPGTPPMMPIEEIGSEDARAFWCSRAIPVEAVPDADEANLLVEGRLAGLLLSGGRPTPARDWLETPEAIDGLPSIEIAGEWLDAPWDLVSVNPATSRMKCTSNVRGSTSSSYDCPLMVMLTRTRGQGNGAAGWLVASSYELLATALTRPALSPENQRRRGTGLEPGERVALATTQGRQSRQPHLGAPHHKHTAQRRASEMHE